MASVEFSEDHHVSRYCKPSAVHRDGTPMARAFSLRRGEKYLSLNWLEYFRKSSRNEELDCVRGVFKKKKYRLRPNGRFAVFRVRTAVDKVKQLTRQRVEVRHLNQDHDWSHVGLFSYTRLDVEITVALRDVSRKDVYPAVVQSSRR